MHFTVMLCTIQCTMEIFKLRIMQHHSTGRQLHYIMKIRGTSWAALYHITNIESLFDVNLQQTSVSFYVKY